MRRCRPTTTGRRCSTRRWATPTTRCRRCSTPWCCTGSCAGGCPTTTRRPTSAACSTSTSAACAGRTPRGSTGRRAASSPGGRPWPWWRSCPPCWTGPTSERSLGMSELFEPVDAHDRDLALTAPPALAAVNAAGVITAADVHIATTLGQLGGERRSRRAARHRAHVTGRAARVGVPGAGRRRDPARRPRPAVAGARRVVGGDRAEPAARRSACCTGSTACSTSTATTSRRPRSSTT